MIKLIILVIMLFICIICLYKEYKVAMYEKDKYISNLLKRINRLESDSMANVKLLNWLYNELSAKGIVKDYDEIEVKK